MTRFTKPSQDTPEPTITSDSSNNPSHDSRHDSRANSSDSGIDALILSRRDSLQLNHVQAATAVVSLGAIRRNLAAIKSANPECEHLAVVKANAYGHGLHAIAQALQNHIDYLAVARIDEGVALRLQSVNCPIVVLSESITARTVELCKRYQLTPCLFDSSQLEEQLGLVSAHQTDYWLKVNSGMNRLGISPLQIDALREILAQTDSRQPAVVFTHFSDSEIRDNTVTQQQLEIFEGFCEALPVSKDCKLSAANSAATLRGSVATPILQRHTIINRIGISLYGIAFGETADVWQDTLEPTLSLYAPVVALQSVPAGQSVGYNGTWTAERDSVIATLAIGYGDGYPRQAPSGTPVMFGDERAPLVGNVSMDMIGVDITSLQSRDAIQVGSLACLWGHSVDNSGQTCGAELDITEIADCASYIPYQLLTQISERVTRIYLSD